MRMEWVSNNRFTIFLTFDDLLDRGFTDDDIWYDMAEVRNLFSDMMYEACDELGFELEGMLLVKVHLMQAQGMFVDVTREPEQEHHDEYDDDAIEMRVMLDESKELIYSFNEFDDIIHVASYLSPLNIQGGRIYYMNDRYYMLLENSDLHEQNKEQIIAIMSEFALPSIITSIRLFEYGKVIMKQNAIKKIITTFYK